MTHVRTRRRLHAVLWTAAGVSVTANILSAEPTVVGRGVAAWPPVALLLVVKVLARSPLPAGRTRWLAVAGAGIVATVAAVASFAHMHQVAQAAGESALVAWLFPLTVDGLAVVASVALVEANQRATAPEPAAELPDPTPADSLVRAASFEIPLVGVTQSPVLNGTGSTNNHRAKEHT